MPIRHFYELNFIQFYYFAYESGGGGGGVKAALNHSQRFYENHLIIIKL